MLKSKKKKDDQSPSKKALSSDYDGDQAINSSEAETSPGSEDKASISTSGSKSALKSSKKAAKKSSKAKKSDEVSIKMPATIPTPKTRKPPSRFSLRGTLMCTLLLSILALSLYSSVPNRDAGTFINFDEKIPDIPIIRPLFYSALLKCLHLFLVTTI